MNQVQAKTNLRSDSGKILAVVTVVRNPIGDRSARDICGAAACRAAMSFLRAIPFQTSIVTAYYPDTGESVVLNQHPFNYASLTSKASEMDFSKIFKDDATRATEVAALPRRLVAPMPNVVPEDGVLNFVTVESIKDIISAPSQSVLLFSEQNYDLLELVIDHSTRFDFSPFVLSGLPSADYNPAFESKTYQLERVAYSSLINDLIEAKHIADALEQESMTGYDKERSQFTRKNGFVKELPGTKIAGAPDAVEPADSGDE